jgi:hypothetical protein
MAVFTAIPAFLFLQDPALSCFYDFQVFWGGGIGCLGFALLAAYRENVGELVQ